MTSYICTHIYTYKYITTINGQNRAMHLKKSKERYIAVFGGRKGKREMK